MNKENKALAITKRIGGTIMLPGIMFVIMLLLCIARGPQPVVYGTLPMWKSVIISVAASTTTAMGIGLQFKNGRFDFSGGSIMALTGIIAGNIAKDAGLGLLPLMILCVLISVVLSVLVGLFYVYGRLPIVIASISMALLYEAISCNIWQGKGVTLFNITEYARIATFPLVLIPLIIVVLIYAFYSYLSKSGKQSTLLANNQASAVNIGVKEPRNILISYVYSGIIFGFATVISLGSNQVSAFFVNLSTVSQLFSNILPVFIGLMVAGFCGDTIGTVIGSLTLSLMSYGLTTVFLNETGSSLSTIFTALFILIINIVSAQGRAFLKKIGSMFKKGVRSTG